VSPPDKTLHDPESDDPRRDAGNTTHAAVYEPGEQIAARYEVLDLLGRGASGAVYKVKDHASGEVVAVKIINDPVGGIEGLRREVRMAWRVTHPNVVRVFDIVEHRGGALLSMQYASGGTLVDRVGKPHAEGEVRAIATSILDALEAAHEAGVIHRDLKPANVLVDGAGRLLLSDFGVAKRVGTVSATGEGGLSGTPAYMAPEQLTGDEVDARTDLYALGILMYQLLSGSLPFVPAGCEPTLPMALKRVAAEVPSLEGSPLAKAVSALTRRKPGDRPGTAAEARALIEGTAKASPAARRRRSAWLAALVAAMLAAAGVVVWSQRSGDDTPPRPSANVEPIVRRLTAGDASIDQPVTFARDGTVVFASNQLGPFQIWALDADDATARPLTSGPLPKTAPQIIGDWLYFQRGRTDGGFDLVKLPTSSLESEPTGAEAVLVAADVRRARVSASGRALSLEPLPGLDHQARIRVFSPATGVEQIVGPETQQLTYADWSPNGTRIAYARRDHLKDEIGSIWLLDPLDAEPRLLADRVPAWTGFAWADDDTIFFF